MIELIDLQKSFKDVLAVDNVSFTAEKGEIFGLLGPNGAGKTTTLRMMYGLLKPDHGGVYIEKDNVSDNILLVQKKMGVLPDGGSLYTRLTARENIRYFGELQGVEKKALNNKIGELSEILGMEEIIDRKALGFSQGQRMKVRLARALVHDPEYILLDEPTNGLDVTTTRAVRNLLLQLKTQGKCIIFSSHVMHEVSRLCDRVGIIDHGKVIISGTIDDVIKKSNTEDLEEAFVHFTHDGAKNAAIEV